MGCGAAVLICRHLGFYSKLEIIKKRRKLKIFYCDRHVKYDIGKHFAAFCERFVLFLAKNGLTTCYL